MGIKLVSSSGGSVELVAPTTASNYTLTVPANNGTVITTASTFAGNGPAFSAYQSVAHSLSSNVTTKIQLQSEDFDTNSNYDTTNYRFTPTVAGYYQVTGSFGVNVTAQSLLAYIYKNGFEFKRGEQPSAATRWVATVNCLVYLNGSSDYIELYGNSGGTINTYPNGNQTYFSAALVRAA